MIFQLILLIIAGIVGLIILWKLCRSILAEIACAIYYALIIFAWLTFAIWHLYGEAACVIF